jgi:hypothetical protein
VFPVREERHLRTKKYRYPRNRQWGPIGVFVVRYKHHLLNKSKAVPRKHVVEVHRRVSCEVQTSSTYKKLKLRL